MKKNFLKKLAIFTMVGALSLSLVACDKDDDKKDKKEKKSTESDSGDGFGGFGNGDAVIDDGGDIGIDDGGDIGIVPESSTEANVVDPNANYGEFAGVSYIIPEGFEENQKTDASVMYVNSSGIAIMLAIDNNNSVTESVAFDQFDKQIKQVFGSQVTSSKTSFNGHSATEWITDNPDGSYVGRSVVICDGNMLIYIEYVSYAGNFEGYSTLVDSITY